MPLETQPRIRKNRHLMTRYKSIPLARIASVVVGVALAFSGILVAAAALYQLSLSIAAFFYRGFRSGTNAVQPPRSRLVIVVPAHDEATLIARCIASLRAQTYPQDLYDIVVIADNCTDDTAAVATTAGAEVLVRVSPHARGKGRALRWGIERVIHRTPAPDGIVVVDADSEADPSFLEALVQPLDQGAQAVQGESLLTPDGSPQAAFRAAA